MEKGQRIGFWNREPGLAVSSSHSIPGLIFSALLMGVLLAGCGGGGGGPNPPTYRALGVGVIIQGQNNIGSFSIGSYGAFTKPDIYRKWINLAPGCSQPRIQSESVFWAAAVSDQFLKDNTALILLAWDKVNGADHYHIYYGSRMVWESDKVDSGEDPGGFNPNNPQVYLDLDYELKEYIIQAGVYKFQIVAVNSGDIEGTRLPEVSASLGMVLGMIPQNISYANPNLTWDSIDYADEYKITIFDGDEYETSEFIYPDITHTNSYNISAIGLNNGVRYNVWVDARSLDSLGNLKEIIRGIGWFDY